MRRMAAALLALLRGFYANRLAAPFGWAAGFLRSNRQAVYAWPEPVARLSETKLGPKVVLFVHFDGGGAVRGYVRTYLHALRDAGLDVVFVSNSETLRPEALGFLQTVCAGIIVRRNIGYDFGAFHDALASLGLPRDDTEMVVLANDSVYGPIREIGSVLSRVDFEAADLWGLTESWQTRFHLQSYFIAVGPAAMRSKAWAEFWARVRPVASKPLVVKMYEVGLSQAMLKGQLRCRALWPYPELTADLDESLFFRPGRNEPEIEDPAILHRRIHVRHVRNAVMQRVPLNPTSDLWRQLLDAGYPFLKRELLRSNPSGVADVADWRGKLARMQVDASDIEADLQRALKNRSP